MRSYRSGQSVHGRSKNTSSQEFRANDSEMDGVDIYGNMKLTNLDGAAKALAELGLKNIRSYPIPAIRISKVAENYKRSEKEAIMTQ